MQPRPVQSGTGLAAYSEAGRGRRCLGVSAAEVYRVVFRRCQDDEGQEQEGGGDPFQLHQQVPGT